MYSHQDYLDRVNKKILSKNISADELKLEISGHSTLELIPIINLIKESDFNYDIWDIFISHFHKRYSSILEHINNPSEELKNRILKANGLEIENIAKPTEEQCFIALASNYYSVQFIKDPTDEMIKRSILKNGHQIIFAKEITEEIAWMAITTTPSSINKIKNPSYAKWVYCISKVPSLISDVKNKDILNQLIIKGYFDLDEIEKIFNYEYDFYYNWLMKLSSVSIQVLLKRTSNITMINMLKNLPNYQTDTELLLSAIE